MPDRTATDAVVATGSLSSPAWLPYLHGIAQDVVLFGGAVLVLVRLAFAIRDLVSGRRPKVD